MNENKTCASCGKILKDHSNTQLKKCELITRILKQEQEDLTQIKAQGLLSAITMLVPLFSKAIFEKEKKKRYKRDEK